MNRKRILCFGDSNTWGYDGITGSRFGYSARWPQVLQNILGDSYHIIEEGLCGRTTVFDDPLQENLNGLKALEMILKTHAPIDLLIIMLGTNDTKERFSANAKNIAMGCESLVHLAKKLDVWKHDSRILLLAPILIDKRIYNTEYGLSMGEYCAEKSLKLLNYLRPLSETLNINYYDINKDCTVNEVDFMHLNEKSHQILGKRLSKVIPSIK